jgi:hypothetical protein
MGLAASGVTNDVPERNHTEGNTEKPGNHVTHMHLTVHKSKNSASKRS